MSSAEKRDEARTWYFKASNVAIARPEGAGYDPKFFSNILDACKTIQMSTNSIKIEKEQRAGEKLENLYPPPAEAHC